MLSRVIVRIVVACIGLHFSNPSFAATIYVDAAAAGLADGSSWTNAHTDLQAGLAAATTGDVIKVAQGVYRPDMTSPYDQAASFALVNGVKLQGGYRGGATNPDDRDYVLYETILSGDLDDDDEACQGDTETPDTDNSEHVIIADNISNATDTLLEGFTITAGVADRSPGASFVDIGGGMVNDTVVNYVVRDCIFVCNYAKFFGGAVANYASGGPVFVDCQFIDNHAGFNDGGAVNQGASNSTFTNCQFESNRSSWGVGGAVSASNADELSFINCVFTENEALEGGAVHAQTIENPSEYRECIFTGNTAVLGGAIYHNSVLTVAVTESRFEDNAAIGSFPGGRGGAIFSKIFDPDGQTITVTLSAFDSNQAESQGGAIYNTGPSLSLRKTSFFGNEATTEKGGAIHDYSLSPLFVDCRFESNTAGGVGGAVYAEGLTGDSLLTLVNTTFMGNESGAGGYDGGGLATSSTDMDATNCLWAKNTASGNGGAIISNSGTVLLTNCTLADNTAEGSGGGLNVPDCTLRNCILWGNADASGFTTAAQIAGISTPPVTYSNVMGGVLNGSGQTNNISTNPWFVDPDDDNYRIRLCSACLDACDYDAIDDDTYDVDDFAGNNGDATPDLDLHVRAVDRSSITDTGTGSYTFTDMGAFENCIGDANGDQKVNGLDIQPFVNCLLESAAESDVCDCADSTLDGDLTLDDVPCFVSVLLGVTDGCYTCAEGGLERGIADCNENEVPDANDIAEGTSQDCNGNFIPDECDIAAETSVDVDENGVPDECQADCNGNDVPDEKDIADEESLDCNENGIPDECERDCNSNGVPDDCDLDPEDPDGDEWVSADCNANGVADECEDDCNENGVPDDCDVDPLDPDGDEWVSPDCNANGYPDECDLTLPPGLGSYDCNENEIPDECDIADETSCDANANGVPDECDILLEECVDANEDDCCDEEESLMGGGEGGGESMMSSSSTGPCAELTEADCWAVFHDWAMQQCWGPGCETTGYEQFQVAKEKLTELGLP